MKTDIPKYDEMAVQCFNCLVGLSCITANFIPLTCSLGAQGGLPRWRLFSVVLKFYSDSLSP